jgi:hypothetical protein
MRRIYVSAVLIKLVMVVTCFILMAHSVEYNDFEQINGWTTAVHDSFNTFSPVSWWDTLSLYNI